MLGMNLGIPLKEANSGMVVLGVIPTHSLPIEPASCVKMKCRQRAAGSAIEEPQANLHERSCVTCGRCARPSPLFLARTHAIYIIYIYIYVYRQCRHTHTPHTTHHTPHTTHHTPHTTHHTPHTTHHTPHTTHHTTQHTTHNTQHTTHTTQHTTQNTEHRTHNTQHTTHNTHSTTHNTQHTKHKTQHTHTHTHTERHTYTYSSRLFHACARSLNGSMAPSNPQPCCTEAR